jgi:hypothetical protein
VRRMHAEAELEEHKHRDVSSYRSPALVLWRRDRDVAMVTIRLYDCARPGSMDEDEAPTGQGPLVTIRFADWLDLVRP